MGDCARWSLDRPGFSLLSSKDKTSQNHMALGAVFPIRLHSLDQRSYLGPHQHIRASSGGHRNQFSVYWNDLLGLREQCWRYWFNYVDYFSIVAFAKKGKGMVAIAGIYSGQLFNLLIGLGLSYVIKGIRKGYLF